MGLDPQTYVNTTIDCNQLSLIFLEYFSKDAAVCTCCAHSIKGQQDRVLSYKYPTNVQTHYKKDFNKARNSLTHSTPVKAQPFNLEQEKRIVKFDQPATHCMSSTNQSTFQADFKPFLIRSVQTINVDANETPNKAYYNNPLFVSTTTYGATFGNWTAKPFERVKEITKKPFSIQFKAESSYQQTYKNKAEDKKFMPEYERHYDAQFKIDMKKKGQQGEFGGLMNSTPKNFMGKSTSQDAFKKLY